MEALVRCGHCWKRVPATARFCRRCGFALHPPLPPPRPRLGGGIVAALALLTIGVVLFAGMIGFRSLAVPQPLEPSATPAEPAPAPWPDSVQSDRPDERKTQSPVDDHSNQISDHDE